MSKAYKDLLLKEVKELLIKLPPNVRIRVYYDGMSNGKYTLNELGIKVDQLGTTVDTLTKTVNTLATKVDQLSNVLFEFIKTTNENFKQVNTRIDRIEAHLDHIVQANNLKDSFK